MIANTTTTRPTRQRLTDRSPEILKEFFATALVLAMIKSDGSVTVPPMKARTAPRAK